MANGYDEGVYSELMNWVFWYSEEGVSLVSGVADSR